MTPEQLKQEMELYELKQQEWYAKVMGLKPPAPRLTSPPPSAPPAASGNHDDGEGMEQARDITKEHHVSWLERIRHPFRERRTRQEEKEKKIKEDVQNSSHTAEEMERIQQSGLDASQMMEKQRLIHEAYNQDHGESRGQGHGMGR